MKLARVLV